MSCPNKKLVGMQSVAACAVGDRFAVIKIKKGTPFFQDCDKLFVAACRHLVGEKNEVSVPLPSGPYHERDFGLIRDMLAQTEVCAPDVWELVECDVLCYSETLQEAEDTLTRLVEGKDDPNPRLGNTPRLTNSLQNNISNTASRTPSGRNLRTLPGINSKHGTRVLPNHPDVEFENNSCKEHKPAVLGSSGLTDGGKRETQQLSFTIKIEGAAFESIKPDYVQDKDRRTKRFQGPWTRLINVKIWETKKLPCPFAFKRQHFFEREGFPYYELNGYCTEKQCRSILYGECSEEEEGCTTIQITVSNYCPSIVHKKKLQVSGEFRDLVKSDVRDVKPLAYQHKTANELLDSDSDESCPLIASTQVYAKVRQEGRDESLNIKMYGNDVMTALMNMKAEFPWIRSISTIPFSLPFWTDNQLDFWNLILARLHGQVVIDATGGLPSIFEIIKGHACSDIFFYNIVSKIGDNKIYSLAETLSSAHDGRSIQLWITEWIDSGAGVPREIVLDGAGALMNGVCAAVNDTNYSDYLDSGLDLLEEKSTEKPPCLIKRDSAHFTKQLCNAECFKGDNWVKKDFYVHSLCFARKITLLPEVKKFMTNVFIVAKSETCLPGSACFHATEWLTEKVATFAVEKRSESSNDGTTPQQSAYNYEYLDKDFDDLSPRTKSFVAKIYNDSMRQCCNVQKAPANPYFLPKVCDYLIPLFHQFITWTNVLNPYYPMSNEDPDSAIVEAYYKIVKHDYGLKGPTTVHRFLKKYSEIVNGAIKLGMHELKNMSVPS